MRRLIRRPQQPDYREELPKEISDKFLEIIKILRERTKSEFVAWTKLRTDNYETQYDFEGQNYKISLVKDWNVDLHTNFYTFDLIHLNGEANESKITYFCNADEAENFRLFEVLQETIDNSLRIDKDSKLLSILKKMVEEIN